MATEVSDGAGPPVEIMRLRHADSPAIGPGMASLVLGTIALILFFLPILGVPISAFGLLFGVIGFVMAMLGGRLTLRWSVAGLAMSALALSVNLAVNHAPARLLPQRDVPKQWQPVPDRPFVPPPAHGKWLQN